MWRSLVARVVRDDEVAGSNPVIPTNPKPPESNLQGVCCMCLLPGSPLGRVESLNIQCTQQLARRDYAVLNIGAENRCRLLAGENLLRVHL